MNPITPGLLVMTLFWWAFGVTFLATPGARWRFLVYVVAWHLFTPNWPFWLDALLLLASFTVIEMLVQAILGTGRDADRPVSRTRVHDDAGNPLSAAMAEAKP